MPEPGTSNAIPLAAVAALVQHELRKLWHNRMACFILALVPVSAFFLRAERSRSLPEARDVCYILYWTEDEFVQALKREAPNAFTSDGLKIEVLPASALTSDDGLIRYPVGSHSIQLRTPERTIWYWHSGADPASIWPHVEWFQRAALRHFGRRTDWDVKTSPMKPEFIVLGKETRVTLESIRQPEMMDPTILWMVLFFAACHLPKLSLAEMIANRTIVSIVVTPAGWRGLAIAIHFFYGTLAMLLAVVIAAILRPAALHSASFWVGSLLAVVLYLGVAFTIATTSQSVASASVGTMVYLAAAAIGYAAVVGISRVAGRTPATMLIPEMNLYHTLRNAWTGQDLDLFRLTGLACWAVIWSAIGEICYRRMRDR